MLQSSTMHMEKGCIKKYTSFSFSNSSWSLVCLVMSKPHLSLLLVLQMHTCVVTCVKLSKHTHTRTHTSEKVTSLQDDMNNSDDTVELIPSQLLMITFLTMTPLTEKFLILTHMTGTTASYIPPKGVQVGSINEPDRHGCLRLQHR